MPIKAADLHCKMMHPHVQRDLAFSAKTSRQVNLGLSSRGPIGAMANRRVWPLALLVVAFFFASRTFVAAPGRASDVTAPRAASETAAAASAAAAGLAALPGPAWAEDGGDWFQPFATWQGAMRSITRVFAVKDVQIWSKVYPLLLPQQHCLKAETISASGEARVRMKALS